MDERDRRARFDALFDAAYEPLLAYSRRRAREDADDVVADVFLIAWRRIEDVPGEELPWLYGVARNVILEQRRGARRRAALAMRLDALPRPSGEPTGGQVDLLLRALERLSEPDREAIFLVAWEGLDTRSAARAMRCSQAALRVRLHRARHRLRRHMEEIEAPTHELRVPEPATLKEGS